MWGRVKISVVPFALCVCAGCGFSGGAGGPTPAPLDPPWWDVAWSHRRQVTVDVGDLAPDKGYLGYTAQDEILKKLGKFTMGKGKVFGLWLKQIEDFLDANRGAAGFENEFAIMDEAMISYKSILGTLMGYLGGGKATMMPLFSTRILHATAKLA